MSQATLSIEPVPLLADNYAWLLFRAGQRDAVVVDPGEAEPVRAALAARGLSLHAVLLTHHHGDHVGGVVDFLATTPKLRVIASAHDQARIHGVTEAVADGDVINLLHERVEVLGTPGHTLGAISYHLPRARAVFTGDTLFLAGCGRLFEGTPDMMWTSLQKLRALPPATRVYCGHEYTEKNLTFAVQTLAEADANTRLADVRILRLAGRPTVPALLSEERATNPFLRADEPSVMAHLGATTALAAFTELRHRRNTF